MTTKSEERLALERALAREQIQYTDYQDSVRERVAASWSYFSLRYGIPEDRIVYTRTLVPIVIDEFVMLFPDPDARPGVRAKKILPFGVAKDAQEYGPLEWKTLEEMDK